MARNNNENLYLALFVCAAAACLYLSQQQTPPQQIQQQPNILVVESPPPPLRRDHERCHPFFGNRTDSTEYCTVGYLQSSTTTLPLHRRRATYNRSRYNYYTHSDQYNSIKLPMTHKGRDSLGDQGVDELWEGETVQVDRYGDMKVRLYPKTSFF
jgi:hypothetical protein